MDQFRGYIFSSETVNYENRNVIKLSGRDNDGTFILYLSNIQNSFFIKSDSKEVDLKREKTDYRNLKGDPLDLIYLEDPSSIYSLREELESDGVLTYEADIRVLEKFYIRTGIGGFIRFQGKYQKKGGVKIFVNPKIEPFEPFEVNPLTTSIDIETSMENDLYSIACYNKSLSHKSQIVFMIGKGHEDRENTIFYDDEPSLLIDFIQYIKQVDPDLIFGWHVIGFDLKFLQNKCDQYDIPFSLGRDNSDINISEKKGSGFFCDIFGRQVIDGPQTLRSLGYSYKNFKLETVASVEVGTGKDIESDEGKVGEIQRRFEEDKLSLAKYNILDCILVTKIFDKLGVVEKLMKRATTLKVPMDKLNIVNSIMDRVVVPMLHREGFIPPNQTSLTSSSKKQNRTFKKPEPGLYKNLFLLELDDIIPNIIQFFSIDFYSKLHNLTDRIETPNNQYFSSTKSIIPRIIKKIIDSETIPTDSKEFAIKQILSGLNNQANRFYDPKIMETIEYTEQWLCETIGRWIENSGGRIIFIDEGDMMISLDDGMERSHLEGVIKKVMRELASQILRDYGVNSKFTLSIKGEYQQIFIPSSGFKSGVSSYIGYNGSDLQYRGVELPQSEYCNYAKDFSEKLLLAIFKEDEVESIVSEAIDRLDEGDFKSEDLLLKNRLPKTIDRERENLPNHLRAALMLNDDQLRFKKEIEYLVCEDNIYPKEIEHGEIDLNFYKEKQIKPLVDNILFVKDMKYEDIIYGSQLTLF